MFQTKHSVRSARDTEGSALLLSEDASYFDSIGPSKGIFSCGRSPPILNELQVSVKIIWNDPILALDRWGPGFHFAL